MRQLRIQNKSVKGSMGFLNLCCLSMLLFFSCFFAIVPAQSAPVKEKTATLLDYLSVEQSHLTTDIKTLKTQPLPVSEAEFKNRMREINALIIITRAKIDSLQGFLENANKQRMTLNHRLKHVQQLPIDNNEYQKQEQRVSRIEALLVENKKVLELIDTNLELAQNFQGELQAKILKLEQWRSNFLLLDKLASIKKAAKTYNQTLSQLYAKNVQANATDAKTKKSNNTISQQATILITNQQIALIHQKLDSLDLQKKLIRAKLALMQNSNIKTLQLTAEIYTSVIIQYSGLETSLQQMLTFLSNENGLLLNWSQKQAIVALQNQVQEQIKVIAQNKILAERELQDIQNQIKKIVSARQSLSDYNINSWPVILEKISAMPGLLFNYLKTLTLKVYDSYLWLGTGAIALLWGMVGSIIGLSFVLNRFLKSLSLTRERSRLAGYLYDGILALVQRNIPYLCFFAILWTLMYGTNISYSNYQLLFNLLAIWFAFRIFVLIARLVLLERISDSSGIDVTLYYRLKWLLMLGGWTTALMTFSHLLPMPLLIQDIFNRLFMMFILSMSLVAWKSKDVINYLLRPLMMGKKRYIKNVVSLLVLLIPLTLLSTAMIGLAGYTNLAWTMSRYQAYFLTVLAGYILARGLLFDALEYFSEWMISSLRNGWLWIEVFLKPFDAILRIILLLTSIGALFQLFGWHSDSLVIQRINAFAHYTIINVTGIHITVVSTVEFFFLVSILVWASKWTREFCYRWLFRDYKDMGIRNSLSVFAQYAIILIGGFITLRVLGLDFSGMSMILGGLAVGMGFGLRDFASNIVGGIMLLIERPVREGDMITIGEYEGQVSHIGIRSMRVSSSDNTEVLIPNAETFNKPFTNWTHQDSIVRTVVPIKVGRSDDPVMVQQLILDVLAIIPEIVPDPPAQVYLKKIDDALVEFEVRYFINIMTHTKVEVRSKVLFAITAQFKAAGIRPPVEPIAVELKEGSYELVKGKTTDL